ncbi:hypothetical protein C900_01292 [Fulvivirga imtechensis AK7]|uniref:YiiG family protein n=1 Tax=Fulvivirga imtechensis AK7 TaxID=1237149 RepID=L8JXZ5_9BACT|nr:hypothetical protein [Fulvivirga imtechensis]ELR72514.1 hypothetical protein C900_01292 [Fulvivirga imtechensis AK7]
MVDRFLIVVLIGLAGSVTVVAQQQTAYDYLQEIGKEYKGIKSDTWDYVRATAHGKAPKIIEKKRLELLATIRQSSYSIKTMKPFGGDPSLKEAALAYLDLNYSVINEDYARIVTLERTSEDSFDAMENYFHAQKLAREKLTEAYDRLDSVQRSFARKYHISIIEDHDRTGEKLHKAAEAFDYYHELYLIFFKSYKQEAKVYDALAEYDLENFEKHRETLLVYARDGISEFNRSGSFGDDAMLLQAGLDMMAFYKKEAEASLEAVAKFLIKKIKMDEQNRRMKTLPADKRTREDVDTYNSVVKSYNEQLNIYKSTSERLSHERARLLDNWNSKVDSFLSTHVPK